MQFSKMLISQSTGNFSLPETSATLSSAYDDTRDKNFDNQYQVEQCHKIHIKTVHNDTKRYISLASVQQVANTASLCH